MVSKDTKRKLVTVGVIGPPIVTVLVLAFLSLKYATVDIKESTLLKDHLNTAEVLRHLVTALQKERGMSCVFISRKPGDPDREKIANKLSVFRQDTNGFVEKTCECAWPGTKFKAKEKFTKEINAFRRSIGEEVEKCDQVIDWYTMVTNELIGSIDRAFLESEQGRFWSEVRSINVLLSAKDIIGIKRAMGGSFFAGGGFKHHFAQQFNELSGAAKKFLLMVWVSVPRAEKVYRRLTDNEWQLMNELIEMEHIISYNNLSHGDTDKGLSWFQNMTAYMSLVGQVEKVMADSIVQKLNDKILVSWYNFLIVAVACVLTAIVCPIMVVKYGVQVTKGRKTEDLLYQMMPKSVAKTFLSTGEVRPKDYLSVTVYESDIFGFNQLLADSTPYQIVDLLNSLYTKCDEIIIKHDCYKVETNGDIMTVVSGLPQLNDTQHSDEICTLALDILEMVDKFKIPNKQEPLLMRIGICTGPCAAGIIGIKKPQYCLLGNTVNLAQRLLFNSPACCIQISASTWQHLKVNHRGKFIVTRRGKIPATKGLVDTFYLIGRQHVKFSIDLEMARAKTRNTEYWKNKDTEIEDV